MQLQLQLFELLLSVWHFSGGSLQSLQFLSAPLESLQQHCVVASADPEARKLNCVRALPNNAAKPLGIRKLFTLQSTTSVRL